VEQRDGLDTDLGWTLGVVFRAYVKAVDEVLSHLPGGPRGYQVLAAAAQETTAGQGALAQRLGIDRTVMTYLIDDLERAGLVERRLDPDDRRNKRIVATALGRERSEAARSRLKAVEDHVLAALEPGDRSTFRGFLQRLAVRAQAADPVRDACQVVEELDGAC